MLTEPQFDPTRVMVNGAAIGLITSLVHELRRDFRDDLHDLEMRLNKRIEAQGGDLHSLEEWRQSEMDRRTHRDGQWSVARNAARFADRYGKFALGAAIVIATTIAAVLGVNIQLGG